MAAQVEVQPGEVGRAVAGGRLHLSPLTDSSNKSLIEIPSINQSHIIASEPNKPVPAPKPRLSPKPFAVEKNPTIKPILAPKPQTKPRPESTRLPGYRPELPSSAKPQHTVAAGKLRPGSTDLNRPAPTSFKTSNKVNTGQTTKPIVQPFKPAPPLDSRDPSNPTSLVRAERQKPGASSYSKSFKKLPAAEWSGTTQKEDEKGQNAQNQGGTSITRAKSMGFLLEVEQEQENKEKAPPEASVPLRPQPRGSRPRPVSAIFPVSPTKTETPVPARWAGRRPLSADLTSKFESIGLSLHRKSPKVDTKENTPEEQALPQKREQDKTPKSTTLQSTDGVDDPALSDQSNKKTEEMVMKETDEDKRRVSIKSRISLLLDSSSVPGAGATGQGSEIQSPVQPVSETEPAVGVKQLIKQLTEDTTPTQSPVMKPVLKPRPLPLDLTKRFSSERSPDLVSLTEAADHHEISKDPQRRAEESAVTPSDQKTFLDLKDSQEQLRKVSMPEGPEAEQTFGNTFKESSASGAVQTVRASLFENFVERHSVLVMDDGKSVNTTKNSLSGPSFKKGVVEDEGTLVTATYKEPVSPSSPMRVLHAFDTVQAVEKNKAVSESVPSAQWEDKAMTLRSKRSEESRPVAERTGPAEGQLALGMMGDLQPRCLRVGSLPKWTTAYPDQSASVEKGMLKVSQREQQVALDDDRDRQRVTEQDDVAAAPKRLKMLPAEEQPKPRATYFALTGQIQEPVSLGNVGTTNIGDMNVPTDDFSARSALSGSQGRILPMRRNPSLDEAFAKTSQSQELVEELMMRSHLSSRDLKELEKQKLREKKEREEAEKLRQVVLEQEMLIIRELDKEKERQRELRSAVDIQTKEMIDAEKKRHLQRETERHMAKMKELEREKQKQLQMEKQAHLEFARMKEMEMQREAERQRQKALEKQKQELEEKHALEKQKQIELEKQRLEELEREKQKEHERERQRQLEREKQELERMQERERQREKERQTQREEERQRELDKERQLLEIQKEKQKMEAMERIKEQERQQLLEFQKQKQKEKERQQIIELEKQRLREKKEREEAAKIKQMALEQEMLRLRELDKERERQKEREHQREVERQEHERQRLLELQKQKQKEKERQQLIELEKQRLREKKDREEAEKIKQMALEQEMLRIRQLDKERERQQEMEHQKEIEREKQEQERQQLLELQKQKRKEKERQQLMELEKQRLREKKDREEAEKIKQMALEQEMLRIRELDKERERQKEMEREHQREIERGKQEQERQQLLELQKQKQKERQQLMELEKQRLREKKEREEAEKIKQMALEQEMLRIRELDKERERQQEMEHQKEIEWEKQREMEQQRQRDLERERQRRLDIERQEMENQRLRQREKEKQKMEDLEKLKEMERIQLLEFEKQKQAERDRQQILELEKRRLREKMEREEAEKIRQVAKQQEAERQRLKEKQRKEEQERLRLESSPLRPKVLDLDSVLRNDIPTKATSQRSDPATRWKEPYKPTILDIDSFTSQAQLSPGKDLFPVSGIQGIDPEFGARLQPTPERDISWKVPSQTSGGFSSPVWPAAPQDPWELQSVEMSVDNPVAEPRKHANKLSPEQLLLRQDERLGNPQRQWPAVVDEPLHITPFPGTGAKTATTPGELSSSALVEQIWLTREPQPQESRGEVQSQRGSQELNRMRSRSVSRRSAPPGSSVEGNLSRVRSRSAHREQDRPSWVQQKQSGEEEGKDSETPVRETDSQYGTWETGLRTDDSLTPATPSSEGNLSPSLRKHTPPHTPGDPASQSEADTPDDLPPSSSSESQPFSFPDAPTTLLDTSALRSRAQLGKKRAPRTRPSRAARQSAVPAEGGTTEDWLYRDSTEAKPENKDDGSNSEEQARGMDASPAVASQPQRIALFPGVDPSALKAQLKKRGDSDNQVDGPAPAPSQLSRSPKSPFLPRAARVLPPPGGKENGEEDSPQWLKELKSKKRLSQYENDS